MLRIRTIFAAAAVVAVALAMRTGFADERTPVESIRKVISAVRLASPVSQRGMTIIPLVAKDESALPLRTLSEALKTSAVVVREIGDGRVNELSVENKSDAYVFIMAGQILVGAKQNRVLQSDLLLPPHSGRVSVEAFCVEHGRWQYESAGPSSGTFARTDNVSNPEVRAAARATKSQTSVWGAVADSQEKVKAPNATGDLNKVYNDPKVAKDTKVYVDAFSTLPERVPDMHGAVVLVDGRIMAVDYFGDGRVFRKLWAPLLGSYVLEAVGEGVGQEKAGQAMAREFLQRASRADVTRQATPGAGTLVELNGVGLSGSSLLASNDLLHLELFARTRADDGVKTPNEPPIQRRYQR